MYDKFDVVKIFLPSTAEVISIDTVDKKPTVFMSHINMRDTYIKDTNKGTEAEITATYKDGHDVYIIVLKYYCNGWCLVERKKGKDENEDITVNSDRKSVNILDVKKADVTGDGIIDNIYLIGNKPSGEESPFVDNITLVIEDGNTKKHSTINLKENASYNPRIFLGDFTGDKVCDILVNIDSGGSGGYLFSYIYSFSNSEAKKLFDFEVFNEQCKYDVIYKDNYKVDIINKTLNTKYTLDIEYKGVEYLSKLYNETGKLKEPTKGEVSALNALYPIVTQKDGKFELNAIRRIIGIFNADTLGYVESYLKYEKDKFVLDKQYVSITGEKLSVSRILSDSDYVRNEFQENMRYYYNRAEFDSDYNNKI